MAPVYLGGQELTFVSGASLFDYADSLKVRVPTSCRRTGSCHECIVEIRGGMDALSPPTKPESFLRNNYRLACQALVQDPVQNVEFSVLRRQPQIMTSGVRREITPVPNVVRLGESISIGGRHADRYRGRILGLAADIGTTTVALNLVDLEACQVIHTSSFENPQRFGGSDVMNRISYDEGENKGELQQVMISAINFEIGEMTREVGSHRRYIYDVVLVGNTTMRDIVFGLDVQSVGVKPYKSLAETEYENGLRGGTSLHAKASELGLRVFPEAYVYSGPLIGCHVGPDVSAGLLAIGMDQQEEPVMLVDIGTNSEVVIGNRHGMMAASCPAGPAFEGGQIARGMPGYDGAVESIRIVDGEPTITTIGGKEVQGICGSGLVDLLAELRRNGLINELGVFYNGENGYTFSVEQGMDLTREEISSLAQAKSANYSGQYIVMRNYGTAAGDLAKLYLAGGFANYIDASNAVNIGFIANVPQDHIAKVGNASLEGATIMLLSVGMRNTAEELVKRIKHIELETTVDFFDIFVEGCLFKPMPRDLMP